MRLVLPPGHRSGSVLLPSSKSMAHRLLIAAAFAAHPVRIRCRGTSADIEATARCLSALGAMAVRRADGYDVTPLPYEPGKGFVPRAGAGQPAVLPCGESGSTLRFLLPVTAALGVSAVFVREGRLPLRPLSPLREELERGGLRFREDGKNLFIEGKTNLDNYTVSGNISSQFVTGLLFALAVSPGGGSLRVTGETESADYIRMTEQVLRASGVRIVSRGGLRRVSGGIPFDFPPEVTAEGDWSQAAFFLAAGAMSPRGICLSGLDTASLQGDRRMAALLRLFGAAVSFRDKNVRIRRNFLRGQTVDVRQVPDLVPALAAVAAVSAGTTRITGAARLRLKESDRIASTAAMIRSLGGSAEETEDGLVITGREELSGGTVDSFGDHRIAMAAAAASAACRGRVTILGAECTEKSYPGFWYDFAALEVER